MMMWAKFSSRGTIARRLFYFRYADPDAVQIYQGFALSLVGVALLMVHTSLLGSGVARYYMLWPTTEYYALAAVALSMLCLVIDPRGSSGAPGIVLMGTCCVYWMTMASELFVRFGFAPLSHGLVVFMAAMAMYGSVRQMK